MVCYQRPERPLEDLISFLSTSLVYVELEMCSSSCLNFDVWDERKVRLCQDLADLLTYRLAGEQAFERFLNQSPQVSWIGLLWFSPLPSDNRAICRWGEEESRDRDRRKETSRHARYSPSWTSKREKTNKKTINICGPCAHHILFCSYSCPNDVIKWSPTKWDSSFK